MLMKENATAQRSRPRTMNGMLLSRMFRRPTVSIKLKATSVSAKFVTATDNEVPMGDVKPTRENMVALKYISEFY